MYLSKFVWCYSPACPHNWNPNSKMVNFSGKYVFDHAENMKAVGDALKVDWSKIPVDKTTTTEITQNGDTFHIKTVTAVRTRDVSWNRGGGWEGWRRNVEDYTRGWQIWTTNSTRAYCHHVSSNYSWSLRTTINFGHDDTSFLMVFCNYNKCEREKLNILWAEKLPWVKRLLKNHLHVNLSMTPGPWVKFLTRGADKQGPHLQAGVLHGSFSA